uniref:Uncharacterized protein n=1 Tax=uncultured Planctomycetota bacterium TaxID=120965 RepID=A0A1B0Z238_9BACT|nr:hypothetical protein [uncultured Planctomycetota bacterium]
MNVNDAVLPVAEVEPIEVAPIERAAVEKYLAQHNVPPAPVESSTSVYDRVNNVMEFVETMGAKLAKSGFAGCTKVEQGEMVILECMTRKMSPLEFSATYHIVNAKVTMRSDAMLAKFNQLGGQVEWVTFDEKEATAKFTINGNSTTISYTIADAAKRGLANRAGSWKIHTAEMLRARLISKAIRMVAPQAIAGYYCAEELTDTSQPSKPLFTKE